MNGVTAGNDSLKGILSSFRFRGTYTFLLLPERHSVFLMSIIIRSVSAARFGNVQEFQIFFFFFSYFEPKAITQSA